MKLVSVIIPVYNTEEFLRDCISSILNQSYEKLEILVVNNGSTDHSYQIVQEFEKKDERIRCFNFQERLGVGAARNHGIAQAQGDYIYFLDSDDYLPENTIEFLVNNIGEGNIIRGKMKNTNYSTSFAIVYHGLFNLKYFENNKFILLKSYSAANFLISRNFVEENNLRFSEDIDVYADVNFMADALTQVETVPYVKEALYFKRIRNDTVHNPALGQFAVDKKLKDFLIMYQKQKKKHSDILVHNYLDTKFLNFYRKHLNAHFRDDNAIDDSYSLLADAVQGLNPFILDKYDRVLKHEIKPLYENNKNKYKKVIKRHNFIRDFKKGIKSKQKFYRFIYDKIFLKIPINNKLVFFESFGGKNYSDSPKYIYEALNNEIPEMTSIWSFNEKKDVPGNGRQAKRLSLKYYYTLARAKYWVTNARMPNGLKKRNECIYIQTWHGTPLKKLAGDLNNVSMPGTNPVTYKRNFSNETAKWDYLISPNKYSSEIFKKAFWFQGELLEYGYPRNDILYNKNTEKDIKELKTKFNLPLDKKVILYAPTWRDDEFYSVGKYKFSLKLDLEKMQQSLGDEYIIVLRMHYLIASNLDITAYPSFVFDYSNHSDISELYLISDILITDYSSVFFDYANLKRPILFYTYDLQKYKNQLRGFYLDMEKEVPGPLLETPGDLLEAIRNINVINEKYKNRYKKFYDRFCDFEDGKASNKIIENIIKQ